jgi:hypothetical protein
MKFKICKEIHEVDMRSQSITMERFVAESKTTSSSSSSLYLNLSPNPKISLAMLLEESFFQLKNISWSI